MPMQGLTLQSIKTRWSLIPLFACVGGGVVFAAWYLSRLVTKNPEAAWFKKSNPYPWQNIKANQNIKLYSAGRIDFANLKQRYPNYEEK
ncbi:cytochrome c oxidase subunit NDUFA4-like [Glandiceps talaboti]